MNSLFQEKIPFNIDAEQDLLASLLVNNNNINYVSGFLRPHHFYNGLNQIIYKELQDAINSGKVGDSLTISYKLENNENFKEAGGKTYLNQLMSRMVDIISVTERGQIIYDTFVRRELIKLASEIQSSATNNTDNNSDKTIDIAENKIFNIRNEIVTTSEPKSINQYFQNVIKTTQLVLSGKIKQGLSTGFQDLDNILSGVNPSDLLILAARPSMGKTALAINLAYNIAIKLQSEDKGGIAFFSLEMSSDQIATRVLSMASGVSSTAIRTGKYSKFDEDSSNDNAGLKMTDSDFMKIQDVSEALQSMPFYIDDTPAISTSLLRTRARMLKRRYDISMIVIDYLQLMQASNIGFNSNRVLEISEITQTLKAIAKELNIPVIALSQLSRAVELREDKRPQLADLRESGSIEQDADIVMFIYRDEYYLEKSRPQQPKDPNDTQAKDTKEYKNWIDRMYGSPVKNNDGTFIIDQYTGDVKLFNGAKNIAEIIIAKHRNGPVGSVKLFFDKTKTLFADLVRG